ncbi:uncharacterized protein LOC114755459 [Neltuma alba]|uniref:uncharacterized protein LOC114755459 n=1 Tax=Neltuma alba TaxID=207710 RepID=UPI0010A30752|nr:uncharacterized protein LOC114755459 [Prosopis alba]
MEPETSPRPPRNNQLLFRLRNNHSTPVFNPPTQASFEDSYQNLDTQKDAEKPIEVIPEKPTIDGDVVAAKKLEVPFAEETAVVESVKSCLCNKERAMFPIIILSRLNKEMEGDLLTFKRGMPPRNTNRVSSPPTQTSFDDPEQKFDSEKDAENVIVDAIREKPTTDDDEEDEEAAAKKRKVSFADETAANATVKPWNLRSRNKKPTCSSQPPMKLSEADKENSDEVKNQIIVNFSITVSNKKKEEDFLAFTGKKPSGRPKRRPRNVQKAIDRITPAFEIEEIIDGIIRRSRLLHNHEAVE